MLPAVNSSVMITFVVHKMEGEAASLDSPVTVTHSVINQEQCPFEDSIMISKQFTCNGGVMDVKYYGFKLIVPKGAIEDHCVEIKVAVSLFGPFDIPSNFHPVSPYVWITAVSPADYVFKEQLQIEFQHHADMSELKDISKLCVLKASCTTCSTHHPKMHMTAWNCHFDISDTVCTLFTNHFCSYCLASKSDQVSNRIIAYHYLPENYESADTFRAEICFCYDLSICKETIENRYMQRKMFKNLNIPIRISLTRKDELHVSDPHSVDGWNIIHLSTNKIGFSEIDFREWYKSAEDLEKDENRDIYPPRFITQLNCRQRCTLDVTYTLNLMKDGAIIRDYKFSIYIKGTANQSSKQRKTAIGSGTGETNDVMDTKPDMWHIISITIPRIKAKWDYVAYSMGYSIPAVTAFEKDSHDSEQSCLNLFKDWLSTQNGVTPKTWRTLLDRIKVVDGLQTAAEDIEKIISM